MSTWANLHELSIPSSVSDKMSGGPTMMQSWVGMEPNWARVPPHVPTYPNPPAYFRQTAANKYTYPPQRESYQVRNLILNENSHSVLCNDNQAAPWIYSRGMHLPWPESSLQLGIKSFKNWA